MLTLDFMECFGHKMVIRVVLMSTLRFMSRRGQGRGLTFGWLVVLGLTAL